MLEAAFLVFASPTRVTFFLRSPPVPAVNAHQTPERAFYPAPPTVSHSAQNCSRVHHEFLIKIFHLARREAFWRADNVKSSFLRDLLLAGKSNEARRRWSHWFPVNFPRQLGRGGKSFCRNRSLLKSGLIRKIYYKAQRERKEEGECDWEERKLSFLPLIFIFHPRASSKARTVDYLSFY